MSSISDALILWYNRHQRDLPWRATRDPYLIWLSEIILQQTQVATGLQYYLRFAERYPDIHHLAVASEDEVLKMWQGLGYYSRARHLLFTARYIDEHYAGHFPCTYHEILRLKGVGKYTAAAIASFAFDLPHAVVDGNVVRVMSRFFAMAEPVDSTIGQRELDRLAHVVMDPERAAQHNQAIMELGALVCRPVQPACDECPLAERCLARQRGVVDLFPFKQRKTAVKHRHFIYIWCQDGDEVFVQRREGNDIWKGLYQFPMFEVTQPVDVNHVGAIVAERMGVTSDAVVVMSVHETRHVLTHQRLHLTIIRVMFHRDSMPLFFCDYERVSLENIHQYAFPKPLVDYLDLLGA
ncbi:MAG: A/G-specific adenine glycosylase [Marinilabiliaceae bacterium]|nr:A/G-specific adenine glycosylase [Marinilabiliaceae bacterium]